MRDVTELSNEELELIFNGEGDLSDEDSLGLRLNDENILEVRYALAVALRKIRAYQVLTATGAALAQGVLDNRVDQEFKDLAADYKALEFNNSIKVLNNNYDRKSPLDPEGEPCDTGNV